MENVLGTQELVDTIAYYIHDDHVSLRAASSINTKFHASCTPHLFRSIVFRFEPSDPRQSCRILLFRSILTGAPHIARLVQTLRVSGNFCLPQREEESRDTCILQILDMLTSLSRVEFCHLTPPCPRFFSEGIWKNLPWVLRNDLPPLLLSRLREITFKNLTDIPLGLLHSWSTSLKNVQLIESSIENEELVGQCEAPNPRRPQLESFSIFYPRYYGPPISHFGGPQSPFDLCQLRTLNTFVDLSDPDDQLELWEFIRPLKAHIECLGLRSQGPDSYFFFPEVLALEQLTNLRSLHLVFTLVHDSTQEVRWLDYLLQKFVLPAPVEEIAITIKLRTSYSAKLMATEWAQAEWAALDNTAHNATFPFLRTFTFNIHRRLDRRAMDDTELKAVITSKMSRLHRRGILEVRIITAMPPDVALADE